MNPDRPITSALLASLAVFVLAIPIASSPTQVAAQAKPVDQVALPASPDQVREIVVSTKNGLVGAIAEATKVLAANPGKRVTIQLSTCDQQTWPREVKANGTIEIVGCGDSPAGVGGNPHAQRNDILSAWIFDGSTVQSPIELRGVTLHFNHNMFKVTDSVIIRNSVIKQYLPFPTREPRIIDVHFDQSSSRNKHIVIADSRIESSRIHDGDFGQATYTVHNNVINYSPRVDNPAIALTPVSGDPNQVTITNNQITAIEPWLFAPLIHLERPKVRVEGNHLVMERPHLDAMAFNVINPASSSNAPIKEVRIVHNTIRAPYVMLNAKGAPLDRDAVVFTNNDLRGSLKMLPTTGDATDAKHTVSPGDRIDATQNIWGTINRNQVTARTDNPLDGGGVQPPAQPAPPVITVDKANGLVDAITNATKALENPLVEHAFIHVTTCDEQTLPPGIHAKGKITITGCGTEPAGVGGNDQAQRTKLVFPPSRNGVIINSPVEISGFTGVITDKAFNPNDTLIVKNSVFTGKPAFYFSKTVLFNATMPFTPDSKYLVLQHSTIKNVNPFLGKGQDQHLIVTDNKIEYSPTVLAPAFDLYANVRNQGRSVITGNAFTGSPEMQSVFIRVSRPNVEISRNTFDFPKAPETFAALAIFDRSPGDGPAVEHLNVEYNTFVGGHAVSNPKSTALRHGALQFHHNHVAGASGMLPYVDHDYLSLYTQSDREAFDARRNYWGALDLTKIKAITDDALTDPKLAGPDAYVPPAPPVPQPPAPPAPQPPSPGGSGPGSTNPGGSQVPAPNPLPRPSEPKIDAGPRSVHRFAGETRFETAGAVAKAQYKSGAKVVILARGDVAADSVSAVPLADEYDAPILLSQSDTLHPEAAAEIKRLLPQGGKVIFMGGEVALSQRVEDQVKALGGQVERIAGANRAGTAVETANWLKQAGKLKHLLIADGTDWQPDLIAGPAAAAVTGATLLTNGAAMAPETAAFLNANTSLPVTAIGTVAKTAAKVSDAVEAEHAEALSLAVAKRFFTDPKAVGLATTADFADALAGGAHIADYDGPMVLMGTQMPGTVRTWIDQAPNLTNIMVYGGVLRIPDTALEGLETKK